MPLQPVHQREAAQALRAKLLTAQPPSEVNPKIEALVNEIIGRVADKWAMLVLETLEEHGELRFTRISSLIPGVSQKMLTKTLRQMERDGLLVRTIHPIIPPRVEYRLTPLGQSLSLAFCGVWIWAEAHHEEVEQARRVFDEAAHDGPAAQAK